MMCERQNTVVFSFDTRSPRVNAYQIHEWLHDTALIREEDVRVIQIDGPLRNVYVKFVSPDKMTNTLQQFQGDLQFYLENGDISSVKVEITGVGIRLVRVSTPPPQKKIYRRTDQKRPVNVWRHQTNTRRGIVAGL